MRDQNQLQCPACKAEFAKLTITEFAVVCPECGEVMFSYRTPGQPMSRGMLYAHLDGSRMAYIGKVRPWLHPSRYSSAPVLLGYLSSVIADTLEE